MQKKHLFIGTLIWMVVGLTSAFLLRDIDNDMEVAGLAEAVAVTSTQQFDGLSDAEDILDELYYPIGLAIMGDYLVMADSMGDRIQILDGAYNQRIGLPGRFGLSYGQSGAFIDGFREYAMFMKPSGVFVTHEGDILVADTENNAIRKITGAFVITVAGNGTAGARDGRETQATFNNPRAVVMCKQGYIYVADTLNHTLRVIDPSGDVRLFAGAPGQSGFVDGALLDARLFQPSGLYITENGVLYIADSANHAIRRVENGVITTVAGQPGAAIGLSAYLEGGYIDGPNEQARFNFPRDVALLSNGDILVADSLNHAIRKIMPQGTITLLGGGDVGRFHYSAENLRLTRPEGIATDGETLFISDTMNNVVVSLPLTERVLNGRPSRPQMLADTGLTINSRFAFRGEIRVFMGERRIEMGRIQPWIRGDSIFVPIRPFLEALGAGVYLNESAGILSIVVDDTVTTLVNDLDYFIMRGTMVTTLDELMRLFPYTIEWFPELSLITVYVPQDLRGE